MIKARQVIAVIGICGASVHGSTALGGTAPSGSTAADSAAPSAQPAGLEEIVVTAQKREEKAQNVPISMTVISSEKLDSTTLSGVGELLNTVPGVASVQTPLGSGSQVSVRGVSASAFQSGGSSPIGYYLDSVPFGLVKTAIGPDANAFDLQRVEVLRGPQGTLYGASALNGVVRVLTNDADLNNFSVKLRGSDSDTDGGGNNYRGDMAVNVPIVDGKLAARMVLGYQSFSGWIDTPLVNNVNTSILRTFRLKVNAQPTDDLAVSTSIWSSRNSIGAPPIGGDDGRDNRLLAQPATVNYDAYGLKVAYDLSGYVFTSMTSHLKYSNQGYFDLSPEFGIPLTGLYTRIDSNVTSEELLINSPQEDVLRWTFGGMYRRATEDTTQTITPVVPTQWMDNTSNSFAVFGELTWSLLPHTLELTAGMRVFEDHVTQANRVSPMSPWIDDSARFHATTPRAVITWHPASGLMTYASYSQGFRSGFPQNAGITQPPVQADTLNNYELGAKETFLDGRLALDSAVYHIDWKRVQQLLIVDFESAVVNGPSASGNGVDLMLSARPIRDLTLSVSGSWNDLHMDSDGYSGGFLLFPRGSRLNFSPETTLGGSADYGRAMGTSGYRWHISASVNHTSAQVFRTLYGRAVTGTGDPLTTSRVSLGIQAPSWSLELYSDNLNNGRGATIRYPYNDPDYAIRIRPRTTGVQVSYEFQ